jgi:hypothetical protein
MQNNAIQLSDRELDELFYDEAPLRIELKALDATSAAPASPSPSSAPSSPTGSNQDDERIPLPDGVVPKRCGYRTGKCQHLQAVKRNGKLHKLCEFHREKANQNQKKLDRKKRLLRFSPYDTNSHFSDDDEANSPRASTHYEPSPRSIDGPFVDYSHIHQQHLDVFAPHPTSLQEAPQALAGEELAIFYNLMTFEPSQFAAPAYAPLSYHRNHHVPQYSVV